MTQSPGGEDALTLSAFVWTVYEDLDVLVDMRNALLAPPEGGAELESTGLRAYADLLGETWPEVSETRWEVLTAVDRLPVEVLHRYGLTGLELMVKLELWRRARAVLTEEILTEGEDIYYPSAPTAPSPHPPLPAARRFTRTKRVLRWVSRMLGRADILLGSLAALVKESERLKEIKETLEKVSGEVADDLKD